MMKIDVGLTWVRLILVGYVAVFGLAGTASAQMKVTIQGHRLTVTSMTPGGRLAVVGVEQESRPWHTVLETVQLQGQDEARQGEIELKLKSQPPKQSVWIGMALASATVAVADLARGPKPGEKRPIIALQESADGMGSELRVTGNLVTVFVLREGQGPWLITAGDGGASDAGPAGDGEVLVVSGRFSNMNSEGIPLVFRAGDTVGAIDMHSLGWQVATLGESDVQDAGASGGRER